MTQTIQQQLEAALIARGWARHKVMSGRCLVMRKDGHAKQIFLGPAGSCRVGVTRTTSHDAQKLKTSLLSVPML